MMEIIGVKKGEKVVMPCIAISNKEGYTYAEAPADGVKLILKPVESSGGCVFIPATLLAHAGYGHMEDGVRNLAWWVKLFDKSELVEIADRLHLETTGTKTDLVQRILRIL